MDVDNEIRSKLEELKDLLRDENGKLSEENKKRFKELGNDISKIREYEDQLKEIKAKMKKGDPK
ncbi:MAG: hypothetical protein U9R75_05810 [Candidatus Thermoplasmatota archaeon]|nr:hypothetical protein [Candidatus Thermoplasmatota archaeon]